ncbi:MAG: hypothetical protein AAGM46_28535, partial [Cyanobacteria bacterium J06582_2]
NPEVRIAPPNRLTSSLSLADGIDRRQWWIGYLTTDDWQRKREILSFSLLLLCPKDLDVLWRLALHLNLRLARTLRAS